MMRKLPVLLNPFIKTRYPYNKLKICRRCNNFTVLGDTKCPVCGKAALQSVEKRASSMLQRSMWKARLIALLIIVVGLAMSGSTMQSSLFAAGGLALLALLWTIQRR